MKLIGKQLLDGLSITRKDVELMDEGFRKTGILSAEQALAMVAAQPERFEGGGSTCKVRYIRWVNTEPTVAQAAFAAAHDLPAYDPTFFRTFAGFIGDQTTYAKMRGRR